MEICSDVRLGVTVANGEIGSSRDGVTAEVEGDAIPAYLRRFDGLDVGECNGSKSRLRFNVAHAIIRIYTLLVPFCKFPCLFVFKGQISGSIRLFNQKSTTISV